jgi:hypothetical protein
MAEKKKHRPSGGKKQRNENASDRTRKGADNMDSVRGHIHGFLDDRNAIALRFVNKKTSDEAVDIILKNAPNHTFLFPDASTIIMDRADIPLFEGLRYELQDVAKPDEIPNEEMANLRHENLFGDRESE